LIVLLYLGRKARCRPKSAKFPADSLLPGNFGPETGSP
jgi:hypothetical protein